MSAAPMSSECKAIDERLLDYFYDELADEERVEVESHVAGCARCRAEVAAFQRVREAGRALPLAEPAAAVSATLLYQASAFAQAMKRATAETAPALPAAPRASSRTPSGSRPAVSARSTIVESAPHPSSPPPPVVVMTTVAERASPAPRVSFFRRVGRHPGYAMAATFLVVGVAAGVTLTVYRGAPAGGSREPAMAAAPTAGAPGSLDNKTLDHEMVAVAEKPSQRPMEAARPAAPADVPALAKERDQRPSPAKDRLAVAFDKSAATEMKRVRRADDGKLDGNSGIPIFEGRLGRSGSGAGGAAASAPTTEHAARVAKSMPPSPSPGQHAGSTKGVSLGADENQVLARSTRPPAPVFAQQEAETRRETTPAPSAPATRPAPSAAPTGFVAAQPALAPLAPARAANPASVAAEPRKAQADLSSLLRRYRAAVAAGDCDSVASLYAKLVEQRPEPPLNTDERKRYVGCLAQLRRLEEMQALRPSSAPPVQAEIDRQLELIARKHSDPAAAPSEGGGSTRAKAAAPRKRYPPAAAEPAPAKAVPAEAPSD